MKKNYSPRYLEGWDDCEKEKNKEIEELKIKIDNLNPRKTFKCPGCNYNLSMNFLCSNGKCLLCNEKIDEKIIKKI